MFAIRPVGYTCCSADKTVKPVTEVSTVRRVAVLLLFGVCLAPAASAQIDTSIVPYEGRTTWAPGVQSGIPARTTICATLQASTFGNGTREASAAINSAIAACPAGQTVKLSAGTFLINNYILLNKSITLRGSGPTLTKLVKTNGAKRYVDRVEDAQPIIVMGPNRWPKIDGRTSVDLDGDAVKGSNTVTVKDAAAAGFAPGQFVLLDEDDYSTAAWTAVPPRKHSNTNSTIWATDRIVFQRHNPSEQYVDDPFPDSLTWFSRAGRPLNELKEIVSVDGDTVTFSTPVHANYPQNRQPQLTRYTNEHVHIRDAGIESLAVSGGGDGNIRIEAAAYSWVKDVDDSMWLGEGIGVQHSFRVEIRDSSIHDGAWPQPGGAGYGISLAWGSSEVLIENNAVVNVNKVIVVRSCGAGSVLGYNYMDNGYIYTIPDWVEVGLNGSHMVGGHHLLFEGNESFNYDSDNTHGNAIAMTVFRNHLTGRRLSFSGMSNARGGGLMMGSWWHSFIGNVIGEAGRMDGWVYEDPGDGSQGNSTSEWGSAPAIWRFGYDPTHWEQAADPKVKSTALRDGNFDFLTNTVRWDREAQELPPSLYLRAKPAFFGDSPWPWVDPTGATKLGSLPARMRPGIGPPIPVLLAPSNLRIQ